jgi:hypothetical protein
MRFELVRINDKGQESSIDIADCPNELEYHKLHHCQDWCVYVHWDDAVKFKVAAVNWAGGASYCFHDPYTDDRCCIREHDHIIPMVRGALFYNNLFSRYASCRVAKTISVFPVGG